jgi:hypothetical protein
MERNILDRETKYLSNSIKKHGKENFKQYVIIYCEEWELERLEIACIKIFHSHSSEWGYNIAWGGKSVMTGRKHSKKTKKLMSESSPRISGENHHLWGTHPSEETRKLMSESHPDSNGENNNFYGKTHSKKAREAIRKARLGIPRSDETKKLFSKAKSGKNNSMWGKKPKNSSSKYLGVSKTSDKKYVYWRCQVRRKYIGQYKTEIEAAKAHDQYIIDNNLPNLLNFPEEYENRN